MGVRKVEFALNCGNIAMIMEITQAMENLMMRCHSALDCQSPQMTVISLRRGFDSTMLVESATVGSHGSRATRYAGESFLDFNPVIPKVGI